MNGRELRRQVIESMREYMAPDSAPITNKVSMISGLLIYAARANILSCSQYKRLTRVKNNFLKENRDEKA